MLTNGNTSPTQQQPDALRDRADELLVACRDALYSVVRRLRHVRELDERGALDEVTRPAALTIVDRSGHAVAQIHDIVEQYDDETRIDGMCLAMAVIQADLEDIRDLADETFGRVEDGVAQAVETDKINDVASKPEAN